MLFSSFHAQSIIVKFTSRNLSPYGGLDTHVITCQLCDEHALGEPITIEKFVVDTITYIIYT